jgi:hypothetical protein
MDGLLIQALGPDNVFVEADPVLIIAEGLIKVGEGDLAAVSVNPGREKRKISQEFETKPERGEENAEPGNQ